jgi:ppGpp synthetase/RelA/SpoT-type nucleotidyltranferase
MPERTRKDRLREEYFDLLPDIRRVVWNLEAEIRYYTRDVLKRLERYEQLVIKSRIKDCESAVEAFLRRQEGRAFDPENPDEYSMRDLPDLAGVRILVFPKSRLVEVDTALRSHFSNWKSDPVPDDIGAPLALKYYGYCNDVSRKVLGEYQIVPMLIGLFWEVEHSAMYKFREVANSKEMRRHRADVESAMSRFEAEFETFLENRDQPPSLTP